MKVIGRCNHRNDMGNGLHRLVFGTSTKMNDGNFHGVYEVLAKTDACEGIKEGSFYELSFTEVADPTAEPAEPVEGDGDDSND